MDIEGLSPRLARAFAWLGPSFAVIFFAGFMLSGLFPPTNPESSASQITAFFSGNTTEIRIGCVLMCLGLALFAPWGAAVAMWTKRMERGFPVLTYTQLLSLGGCVALLVLLPLVWATAAYRPTDTSPDVTRALNDLAWFLFLFTWPPFTLWVGAVGVAILRDRETTPTFPRWVGYLSLWTAALLIPAGLMAFFKSGPMAYNGIIAFYIPLFVFFIWVMAMTSSMLQHITHLERRAGASS